ncbi:MAG: hypothetical protein GY774_17145 [Planctomycetes bacterium]|nr:hypothetical protein [Planctomycetota bacterium]
MSVTTYAGMGCGTRCASIPTHACPRGAASGPRSYLLDLSSRGEKWACDLADLGGKCEFAATASVTCQLGDAAIQREMLVASLVVLAGFKKVIRSVIVCVNKIY